MNPNGIEHFYKDVPGYFDFEDVYREAVEWLPDGGTFVEVGCWQGMSLAYFLVEANKSGKNLKVFGCDHFRGSVNDGPLLHEAGIKSIAGHCFHNLRRAGYPYAMINADSVTGATFFADCSIDYLFVDGSHDYQSVRDDLAAWMPKVRPGGIVAGHDFNQPAVERAVREAFPGRHIEHLKNPRLDHGYVWGTCWRVQL
jgi:hypothetical protein